MRTYKTIVSLFKAMLLTNGDGSLDTKDPRIVDIMDTIAWLRTSLNELGYHYLVDSYDIMSRQILEDRRQLLMLREEQRRTVEKGFA